MTSADESKGSMIGVEDLKKKKLKNYYGQRVGCGN